MKLKLAQFSTIVLFALVVGVFWGTWFALSRSIVTLRAQTFLDIGQTAIRNLAVPMRMMMPLALLSAAVLLVLLPKRSVPFAWAFAGFVLMLCVLVRTAASLPASWEALRDRWEAYHALRTFLSIAALIAVTTSTLSDRP